MLHFISLLLVVIGLHLSIQQSTVTRWVPRNVLSKLTVSNGMNTGSWGEVEMCPTGTYAAGFSLKVDEMSYNPFYDNTALNGIRLHCIDPSKTSVYHGYTTIESKVGSWGQWTEIKWCPSGFLTAFQLNVAPYQIFDDNSAANNIEFICSHGRLLGDGTTWGDWGDYSSTCEGKGICGLMTRVEESEGAWVDWLFDDTGLSDVIMLCCA